MDRIRIRRKEPLYLGIFLIAAGIALRGLIELILVSDGQIELPLYVIMISVFQLLLVGTGLFLLIRQPLIRWAKKSELDLLFFSTFLSFSLLEIPAESG